MQLISSSTRTVALIISGTLLGFIFLQWLSETTQYSDEAIATQNSQLPDYFMSNFTIVTISEDGEIYQELSGEQLTHYKNALTKIEKPALTLRTAKRTIWQGSADSGQILNHTELTLDGNVSIEQTNKNFNLIHISAIRLKLDMSSSLAESNQPVVVTTDKGTIKANKMFANLEKQQIQLYSGVEAEYVSQ